MVAPYGHWTRPDGTEYEGFQERLPVPWWLRWWLPSLAVQALLLWEVLR
jgi:hypothetical protein